MFAGKAYNAIKPAAGAVILKQERLFPGALFMYANAKIYAGSILIGRPLPVCCAAAICHNILASATGGFEYVTAVRAEC